MMHPEERGWIFRRLSLLNNLLTSYINSSHRHLEHCFDPNDRLTKDLLDKLYKNNGHRSLYENIQIRGQQQ